MARPKKYGNEDVAKVVGYESAGRGWWWLPGANKQDSAQAPVRTLPEYGKWMDVVLSAVRAKNAIDEVRAYMLEQGMDVWDPEQICEAFVITQTKG